MAAELRQWDDYPEEDLEFIRELEAEEEDILAGRRSGTRYVTRETVPELRELRKNEIIMPTTRNTGRSRQSAGRSTGRTASSGTRRAAARPVRSNTRQSVRASVEEEGAGSRRPSSGNGKGRKKTLSQKFETGFQHNKPLFFLISRAMIPVIFFYYEMIFNLTTVRDFFGMHAIFILLFSVFFGMIGSVLSSISRSRKVNMIVKAVIIFLPVIPFLIEYFVYLQFKVFYDLNTVLHGAADAAGGFKADIFRLITSFQGITHIILYLLPTVAFLIFELKIDKKHLLSLKTGWRRKIKMGIVSIACYLVALIFIFSL